MAEIEHFCDPNDKRYAAFQNVKDEVLCLFSGENQLTTGKTQFTKIGDAVAQMFVDNEARGGRQDHWRAAWNPSACISVSTSRLKCPTTLQTAGSSGSNFRTAGSSASDTPTAPLAKFTKTVLIATTQPEKHMTIQIAKLKLNRREFGAVFKNEQRNVTSALEALADNWETFEPVATALEADGKTNVDGYEITNAMVT